MYKDSDHTIRIWFCHCRECQKVSITISISIIVSLTLSFLQNIKQELMEICFMVVVILIRMGQIQYCSKWPLSLWLSKKLSNQFKTVVNSFYQPFSMFLPLSLSLYVCFSVFVFEEEKSLCMTYTYMYDITQRNIKVLLIRFQQCGYMCRWCGDTFHILLPT